MLYNEDDACLKFLSCIDNVGSYYIAGREFENDNASFDFLRIGMSRYCGFDADGLVLGEDSRSGYRIQIVKFNFVVEVRGEATHNILSLRI